MSEAGQAVAPEVEAPKPLTHEQQIAQVVEQQLKMHDAADRNERIQKLMRSGKYNPSVEYTDAELKALVPLKRDRWTYIKLAKNAHGLLSFPKTPGRRKKHLTKRAQEIKSMSLAIFKNLFNERAERLKAVCAKESIEYIGVPDSAIPELGARAAKQAIVAVNEKRHAKKQKARRRQEHSRLVNAGVITVGTSESSYVQHGGQFGR
jgi:hypothetical protein